MSHPAKKPARLYSWHGVDKLGRHIVEFDLNRVIGRTK